MVTACLLTGLDWYLHTIPVALVTLAGRWIAVGVWHECERDRARQQRRELAHQQRREWAQQHDRNRRP